MRGGPGDPRPDPGLAMLALCRSPSPRVCVNMCTVCNNISSYHRISLTPSIHSLWPVWGLSKQTPGSVYAGTEASPVTLGTFGARVSSLALYADILVTTQNTRVYFLPVCVCDTGPPLSHKEISVAGQKAEPGSGANGYYMDPGRGAGSQPVRDYKLGLRTLGSISRQFFRFIQTCFDNPCHASWQRQQQ